MHVADLIFYKLSGYAFSVLSKVITCVSRVNLCKTPLFLHFYISNSLFLLFQLSQLWPSTPTQPTPAFGFLYVAPVFMWAKSRPACPTTRSASLSTTSSWALKPSPRADITGRWRWAPRQHGVLVLPQPPLTERRRSASAQMMVSGPWCWGTMAMALAIMKHAQTQRKACYIPPDPPGGWGSTWTMVVVKWGFMMQDTWATSSPSMMQNSKNLFIRTSIPGRSSVEKTGSHSP